MSSRVEAVREHIAAMIEAIPGMPASSSMPRMCFDERLGDRRPGRILTLGRRFCRARLWRRGVVQARDTAHPRASRRCIRSRPSAIAFASSPSGRPLRLGSVVAFAIGSIGAFLAFHWPGLLRDIVLGYLIVFLAIRFTAVLGRFLLAPYNERFRVIPMDTAAARYWHLRWRLIVGWIVLALVTRGIEETLGISPATVDIVGAAFGLSWLAILMEAVWRRPVATSAEIAPENSTFEPGQAECAADRRSCAAVGAARGRGDAGLLAARWSSLSGRSPTG